MHFDCNRFPRVGEAPDAESYGDIGANTFGNVAKANGHLIYLLLKSLVLEQLQI